MNGRRKDSSGSWVDDPNYFDVTVFGSQAENCNRYLSKGRGVAIDGRLDWREWTDKDNQQKRQAVQIIADVVQFLSDGSGGGGNGSSAAAESDIPVDTSDFVAAPGNPDDDIPF